MAEMINTAAPMNACAVKSSSAPVHVAALVVSSLLSSASVAARQTGTLDTTCT